MNQDTFNRILDINKEFYKYIEKDFSTTRQYAWKGWGRVLDNIELDVKSKIDVLDLGCGNGRFYSYLNSKGYKINYVGVDTNEYLLGEAINMTDVGNSKILNLDFISEINKIDSKFDLIVGFGITHHIPSYKYRIDWFKQVIEKLKHEGCLVFTFWDFSKYKNTKIADKNEIMKKGINIEELEAGDFFLKWGSIEDILRYSHKFSDQEIDSIKNEFRVNGLNISDEFRSDGKNNDLNLYLTAKNS